MLYGKIREETRLQQRTLTLLAPIVGREKRQTHGGGVGGRGGMGEKGQGGRSKTGTSAGVGCGLS